MLLSAMWLGVPSSASAVASSTATVTLTGSAPATATGPGTVDFRYSVATPDALTAVILQTAQDTLLPVQPGSVTLDGAPVPTVDIQLAGQDLAIHIAALAAGTHVVAFSATVPTTAGITSSAATLTYLDVSAPGAGPVTSAPVTVAINEPDLVVHTTAFSGLLGDNTDPGTLRLGTLGAGAIEALVTNNGTAATPATLELNLPPNTVFEGAGSADGSDINCTTDPTNAQHVSCPLGTLGRGGSAIVDIDLSTSDNPPVGTAESATISAQVTGTVLTDAHLADNSTVTTIDYIGAAHLSHRVTTPTTKITVGKTGTLTVTVTNDGPQAAPNTVGMIMLQNDDFAIVNFDGPQLPASLLDGASSGSGPGTATVSGTAIAAGSAFARRDSALRQLHAATMHRFAASGSPAPTAAASASPGVLWNIGSLAAGRSSTAHLTLKALKPGGMQIAVVALSDAGDPVCANAPTGQALVTAGCIQLVSLTAVAAPPPTQPGVSHPLSGPSVGTRSGGATLANTGSPATLPTVLGLAMVLIGAFALRLGRRRA